VVRQQKFAQQKRGQGGSIVGSLALFAIVDTRRMILTDPLAPTVPPKLSSIFVAGKIWIANKPEMGFELGLGESSAQTRDATSNATGPGIAVRTFKAEYVKLGVRR
jgi:hypothetical protein